MLPKLTPAESPPTGTANGDTAAAGAPSPDRSAPGAPAAGGAPADGAKRALAWLHGARFLTTASRLDQLPPGDLPEIAFVGRSNAGKSTAINVLTQQRRLAFASRTPGRTQHINLFEVGPREAPEAWLADLPGYGYAAVARDAKRRWQEEMARYLQDRRALAGLVVMVDSRLGFTDLDRQLLAFVEPRVRNGEVRLLALLTKRDKLNRREADAALRAAQEVLGGIATDESDVGVTLFSALSREGVEDVAEVLHGWRQPGGATAATPAGPDAGTGEAPA